MRTLALVAALAATALVPAAGNAADPQLVGTVGPGFTISLKDANGNAVTHLDAGTYTLLVHDLSIDHNFDLLRGTTQSLAKTDVEFSGDRTFTVTLTDGVYNFWCDPHASTMRGTFTVGTSTPPTTTTTTTTTRPAPAPRRISARVGPGSSLSFPARLRAGRYVVTVNDATRADNLHLRGPGVNKATGVRFRGTVRWTVTLRKGTYRVRSDAHPRLARTVTVS